VWATAAILASIQFTHGAKIYLEPRNDMMRNNESFHEALHLANDGNEGWKPTNVLTPTRMNTRRGIQNAMECIHKDDEQNTHDVLSQEACLSVSFHQTLLESSVDVLFGHQKHASGKEHSPTALRGSQDAPNLRNQLKPWLGNMDDISICCSTTCMDDSIATLRLDHMVLEDSMVSLGLHHSVAPITFRRIRSESHLQKQRNQWIHTFGRRRGARQKVPKIQHSGWGNSLSHLPMGRYLLNPLSMSTKALPREQDLSEKEDVQNKDSKT
jgi:hypothetical protein